MIHLIIKNLWKVKYYKHKLNTSMKKIILTILCIIPLLACKNSTNQLPSNNKNDLIVEEEKLISWVQKTIDSTMNHNNIPALSMGIVMNGKLFFSEGYGLYERKGSQEVTKNSLYQIGSNTKQFTGVIIKSLVTEGKLKLTDSIISYLPGLSLEAQRKLSKITIKDLLLHKSGLPSRAPGNKRIDGDPMVVPYNEEDLLSDLNKLDLDFEPGTDFQLFKFRIWCTGLYC